MRTLSRARLLIAGLSAVLAGCVATVGPVVRPAPAPVVVEEVPVDEAAPPAEYVVDGAPVYYAVEPGVAYYPVFIEDAFLCAPVAFCVLPVRFYGGAWYAPGGVIVHRGYWAFHHPGPAHRRALGAWREHRGVFRGHAAEFGRMHRDAQGHVRPVPPHGIHTPPRSGGAHPGPQQHRAPLQQHPAPRPVPQQHAVPPRPMPPHAPPAQHPAAPRPVPPVHRPVPPRPAPPAYHPAPQVHPAPRPAPRPAPSRPAQQRQKCQAGQHC